MNEKPISLIIHDFKDQLSKDINESGLPMCILRPIIQDVLNEIVAAEKQEYIYTKNNYEESLKENDDTKEKS